ncbi:MAG: low temperature requirement protein A [Micromonosporaceae bacterium]|nr:low temperature requirement protein A [Micromonosporaceae bacterium]
MSETTGGGAAQTTAPEQKVSWSELFIDLVWVFSVTEIAAALARGHGLGSVPLSLLLLVPLWWGWVGVTVYSNAAGVRIEAARGRLVLFAVAACGLGMAVAIPGSYGDRGLLFAASYTALRAVLWLAMRPLNFYRGAWVNPYSVSLFLASPLFLLGGLLPGGWRVGLWTLAAAVEVASPRLLRLPVKQMTFETAHLPERFGLFIILALGETVVAMGGQAAASRHITAGLLGVLGLSFALICALWWTYFHFGASAVQHALRTTKVQARIVRDVFSYAHLAYVVGIICVAVGLKKLMAHPLDAPHSAQDLLLAPGAALYLAGFLYSRWRMFGAPTVFRSAAAVGCLALAGVAPLLPLAVTAALVAVIIVALNALEFFWVRTNRPLLLVPVPRVARD